MTWEMVTTAAPTRPMIVSVLHNDVAAIRIPGYVSPDICKLAVQGIHEHGIDYYENVYPPIGKIGITQFEHRFSPVKKRAYFDKAPGATAARRDAFKHSGDLTAQVIATVEQAWEYEASIAVEADSGEEYFAGLVRVMSRALLHMDWAPFDGPEWTIGKIAGQIAWNIYMQMPLQGGSTRVFRRPWEPADEAMKIPGSYGYNMELVNGCESVEILPKEGDLIFFNSRNFHEVLDAQGDIERLTNSSFIGWMKDTEQMIFWS